MEVHAHIPAQPGLEKMPACRQSVTHDSREFLMLFVAVTLGFLNRHHAGEKQRVAGTKATVGAIAAKQFSGNAVE